MSKQNDFSEEVADGAADIFLKENIGSNIFVGADIERLIAQSAQVVYQDIDDPAFFGALVGYKNQKFVILNTHQDLRARYYSAAHEMWHLALVSSMFGKKNDVIKYLATKDNVDKERAADHFAAALMLPEAAVTEIWNKYVEDPETPDSELAKETVIRIANVSSMPYVAVCRRLEELGLLLSHEFVKWDKHHWQSYLKHSEFPPSPLDMAVKFKKFAGLSSFIEAQVEKKQMTLLEAANFLTNAEPDQAIQYLNLRKERIDQLTGDDDG